MRLLDFCRIINLLRDLVDEMKLRTPAVLYTANLCSILLSYGGIGEIA